MAEPKAATKPEPRARTRKALTARTAGIRISDILDKLPSHEDRERALGIAKTLATAG